jgi:hypothetical protein
MDVSERSKGRWICNFEIFGPERERERGGVKGGWRELHNEKLHHFYSSPSIIRVIKWGRWVGRVVHMRK